MNEPQSGPETLEVLHPEVSPLESISRAEVDMQIATAKKYPRNLQRVRSNMMSFATLDEETAQGCFYAVPRGGKTIQGPSVRLAEIAVSCYGNLRAGSRVLSVVFDGPMPHVTVQGVCHDLENNVAFTVEKRRRITKKKNNEMVDEDDVNLAVNSCAAVAFRDAVYKVIPMALIKPVYEQCVQVAIGSAETLVNRRTRAIEKFAKMGVTATQILTRLGRSSVEDITVDDLGVLFGLRNSIKDNQTTVDEEFPPVQSTTQKPNLKADPAAVTTPPASAPTAPPVTTPPPTEKAPKATKKEKPAEPPKEVKPETPPATDVTAPANVVPIPAQQAAEPAPVAAEVKPAEPVQPPVPPAPPQPVSGDVTPTSTPISAAHQSCRDVLMENGVKMSRFLDFMEGSGRFDNATSIGFEGIPEEVVRRIITDTAAFARCLKYCKS